MYDSPRRRVFITGETIVRFSRVVELTDGQIADLRKAPEVEASFWLLKDSADVNEELGDFEEHDIGAWFVDQAGNVTGNVLEDN